ncbi:serine hydrolase [Paenibacillus sp. Marseille-Q4541]|uniref:serine hydrolase domain-containing protein n=1 Tax=Paenibacillus sp. Marseille-Q4541 TaxID=2831522 RepID=UPI001BA642FB|nr:serine hydrolase [Paenibacillus sp. Marseille-Q4541]
MSIDVTGFVHRIKETQLNVYSARILQGGELTGEWDLTRDERRLQHSVSKSFTSMAVGLAIEEGKLTLETKLNDFFTYPTSHHSSQPDIPDPGELTLYELLRMASGHDNPPLWVHERNTLTEKDWAKYYLSLPLDRAPGEQFTYSSGDTFMISALVQAAVGETVKDYLIPRLFTPLGIENVEWESSPLGVTLGCAGLKISNEELSRFGQLLLSKGKWNGEQLVPESWITYATSKHIDTPAEGDWGVGYGCQFWMCTHGAYRADGAHGQLLVILPDKEAVLAINSQEDNIQGILDAVWSDIYPQL